MRAGSINWATGDEIDLQQEETLHKWDIVCTPIHYSSGKSASLIARKGKDLRALYQHAFKPVIKQGISIIARAGTLSRNTKSRFQ